VALRASPETRPNAIEGTMYQQDTSDPWLRRIQALLAKAESTEFPDEAEALLAKAQELMSRHAIDDAMLRSARSSAQSGIETTKIAVPAPYAGPRASLLNAVARANCCRVVIGREPNGGRMCTLVGYGSDVDHTTTLFTALSLQATRAMLRSAPDGDGVRSFRHAFLIGFASRIGERLRRATAEAVGDAERAMGPSVAVALRDRSTAVDAAFADQFPWLRKIRPNISSWSGLRSGRSAADAAALGGAALRGPRSLGPGR
jgi:hypothetical protein